MDLKELVGDWDKFFESIFADNEVRINLSALNQRYKTGYPKIYPDQKNVFRAFRECPYSKLSVVILLQDPYHDGSATGIAMANDADTDILSPSLRIVKDTISRTVYNSHEFDFDPTLISWEKQGVILLNTALTVEDDKPLSHQVLWARFTELLLTKLSEVNSGIIYCLWGKQAEKYAFLINWKSNTILTCTHPVASAYKRIPWDCDHFIKINDQLKKFNNISITW